MVGHHIGRVNILKDFSPVNHQDVFSQACSLLPTLAFFGFIHHTPQFTPATIVQFVLLCLCHTHMHWQTVTSFGGGVGIPIYGFIIPLKPYYGFSTLSTLERFFPSFHIKILVSCSVFEDFCSSPFIVYAIVLTISKVRILLFTKSSNRNR